MQFKQNRSIIYFTLILIQALSILSAPLANSSNPIEKRSPPANEEYPRSVYFIKPSHWGDDVYAYVYSDYVNELPYDAGRPLADWPGKKMYYRENEGRYYTDFAIKYDNFNSHIIFTDGKNQVPGVMQEGFPLVEDAIYDENGLQGYCGEYDSSVSQYVCKKNFAYIFYVKDPSWKRVYVQYKIGNGEWINAPGKQIFMDSLFQKKFHTIIDLGEEEEITLAFTDGKGKWDNNDGKNYTLKALETKVFGKI